MPLMTASMADRTAMPAVALSTGPKCMMLSWPHGRWEGGARTREPQLITPGGAWRHRRTGMEAIAAVDGRAADRKAEAFRLWREVIRTGRRCPSDPRGPRRARASAR